MKYEKDTLFFLSLKTQEKLDGDTDNLKTYP